MITGQLQRLSERFRWLLVAALVLASIALGLAIPFAASSEVRSDSARHLRGPVQLAQLGPRASRGSKAVEYYRARQYHLARAAARVILRGDSSNLAALSILGWSEYQLGRYVEAQQAFARFAQLAPRSSDAQIGLGWSLFKLGRMAEARRHFQAAQPFAVGDERYVVADGLGWIAFAERKLDEAERHFAAEKEQRAHGAIQHDGALGAAWVAMARGDYAAARKHLAEGLKKQPRYFRLYDGAGRVALLQGNHDGAVRYALEGLRLVRFNRELFLLLNAAVERLGDAKAAVKVYEGLIRSYPDVPDYYNGRGWAELRAGHLLKAEASFLIAVQMRRPYPWANLGLYRARGLMHAPIAKAWALYKKGEYEKALKAFDKQMALAGTNPAIQTGRGWALLALGRADAAKAAFAAAVVVDNNFELARKGLVASDAGYRTAYLLGWDHADAKRYDKAQAQFARARAAAPAAERWRVDEALAWLDLLQGRRARAKAAFENILRTHERAPLSRKGLGYIALDEKRYAAAVTQLRASYALEPKQVVTSYSVPADRLNDAGKYRLARELLEIGSQTYEDAPGVLFQLARSYAGFGQQRRAALLAKRAIDKAPIGVNKVFDKLKLPAQDLAELNLQLAWALFFAGDNEGAFRRFDAAVGAKPGDANALRGRAFALFRLKRLEPAIRDLTAVLPAEPRVLGPINEIVPIPGTGRSWPITYNARSTLAWAYFRTKRYKAAAREFRAVLTTYPAWIDALTGLGYCLQKLEDDKGARAQFRAALQISPGYPDAWQGLKGLGADR
jgi:tetratricopeptide (TPR) repeat protein